MKETSKAMRRRWGEDALGAFPWRSLFVGQGIDVGCGPDPVRVGDVTPFDREHGDANALSRHFPAGHFDWLHASQTLEHMIDPWLAFGDWLSVVRAGGHLIITVPSWELYEHKTWPSRFNPDHKSTWSMTALESPAPIHVHMPRFTSHFSGLCRFLICRQLDANYNYRTPAHVDQTWNELDGVEPFIEFVAQRL